MAGRYGLEIRGAEAADAAGLAQAAEAAGRPASPAAVARRLERLAGEGAAVLLALEWGPPTGVAVVTRRAALLDDAPLAELDVLWVAPDDRRRGVGRLLVKAAAQAARQAGATGLRMTTTDPGARAFALASGFEDVDGVLVRPLRKRSD